MDNNINTEITATEETKVSMQTEEKDCQPRYRSWALWVSVLGLVGLILEMTGVFEHIGLDSMKWDIIITSLGTILTAFGIVNNPTCKKKF